MTAAKAAVTESKERESLTMVAVEATEEGLVSESRWRIVMLYIPWFDEQLFFLTQLFFVSHFLSHALCRCGGIVHDC